MTQPWGVGTDHWVYRSRGGHRTSRPTVQFGVCWLLACLTPQQHASVSQGRICYDKRTCYHTETEVVDQTFHLTQSQYTNTGSTNQSADPRTQGAWQGGHWSHNVEVTGKTRPGKSRRKRESNPGSAALAEDALTTRPTRQARRRSCGDQIVTGPCKVSQQRTERSVLAADESCVDM